MNILVIPVLLNRGEKYGMVTTENYSNISYEVVNNEQLLILCFIVSDNHSYSSVLED